MTEITGIVPVTETHVLPGEIFFGPAPGRLTTLLGSCVSVVIWHPVRHLGGLCHYVLPTGRRATRERPGTYADAAIQWLSAEVVRAGTLPRDYRVTLLGGGHMFPAEPRRQGPEVGERNVAAGVALLHAHGFIIHAHDTGGEGHRHVSFDLSTGVVDVRFEQQTAAARLATRRPSRGLQT